jgi:hypothetical protein
LRARTPDRRAKSGADVVAEDADDIRFRHAPGIGFQAVAESLVCLGVELAVGPGEHPKRLHLRLDFGARSRRDLPLLGEVEDRGALEGVVLDPVCIEAERTEAEIGAEAGITHQFLLVRLEAQIVAKEEAVDHLPVRLTDAGSGADREHERDDDARQQHREDDFEVVLKVFLDPSDHGGKGRKLGREGWVARSN